MKYIVKPGCALYIQLAKLRLQIEKSRTISRKLVKELGGKNFAISRSALAGDIAAIKFDKKPEGWKSVGESWQNLFMPLSTNKSVWAKLQKVPVVDNSALNKLINYDSLQIFEHGDCFAISNRPGIMFRKNFVLIEMSEQLNYKPVEGMKEITVSDFNKLKGVK